MTATIRALKRMKSKGKSNSKGKAKPGLYANINAKKARIKAGSGERMRKPGVQGAPTEKNFKDAAKTAKKRPQTTVRGR